MTPQFCLFLAVPGRKEIREECGNDRSWIPYDAMDGYRVFAHPAEGKEETS